MGDIIEITNETQKITITAIHWYQCHLERVHFHCDECGKLLGPGIREGEVLLVCLNCTFTRSIPELVVDDFKKCENTEAKRDYWKSLFTFQNLSCGFKLMSENQEEDEMTKKKSREYWKKKARQIHKVWGETIKDLKTVVEISEKQGESLATYEDNLRVAIEQNGLLYSQLNKIRRIIEYRREDMSDDIYFEIASTLNPEDWNDDSREDQEEEDLTKIQVKPNEVFRDGEWKTIDESESTRKPRKRRSRKYWKRIAKLSLNDQDILIEQLTKSEQRRLLFQRRLIDTLSQLAICEAQRIEDNCGTAGIAQKLQEIRRVYDKWRNPPSNTTFATEYLMNLIGHILNPQPAPAPEPSDQERERGR